MCRSKQTVHAVLLLVLATMAHPFHGCAQTASVLITPSADTFLLMQTPSLNYGDAGALNVSGTAATNMNDDTTGLCSSLIRFPTARVAAAFDATFGSNGWTLTSAALQLNENAAPDNAIFGRGVGAFEIDWIASDDWIEGTGIPRQPTTDGAAWQDLDSILQAGSMSLGQFTNTGVSGPIMFNLAMATSLISNIMKGSDVNFYLFAKSDSVGFTFNSLNFGNTNNQPTLVLTAAARKVSPILAIQPAPSNQIALVFQTSSNWTYQLQVADTLPQGTSAVWTTISTFPSSATNGEVTFLEPATNQQRFYRLSVGP